MGEKPYDSTIRLTDDPESAHANSFRHLQSAFEKLKELYSTNPVLDSDELGMVGEDSSTIFELANLAQVGLWLVAGNLEFLSLADTSFVTMLLSSTSDLSTTMSELCLAIKTQRGVQLLLSEEPDKAAENVLADVFVGDLEDKLRERRGGEELIEADRVLVSSLHARKAAFEALISAQTDIGKS